MPRATSGPKTRQRRKKVLKSAKGYQGGRSKLFRTASASVKRAGAYAYRDRKARKRDFRRLWIIRINAAARENGISYGKLMGLLNKAGIQLDRKVLADMAVHDPSAFAEVVNQAQSA